MQAVCKSHCLISNRFKFPIFLLLIVPTLSFHQSLQWDHLGNLHSAIVSLRTGDWSVRPNLNSILEPVTMFLLEQGTKSVSLLVTLAIAFDYIVPNQICKKRLYLQCGQATAPPSIVKNCRPERPLCKISTSK